MNQIYKKLFNRAKKARNNAYAPFSNFKVGASVLTAKGNVYTGCNVESVSFTLTAHAEMSAIDSAVVAGEILIEKILVVTDSANPVFPCALCRQKIAEFSSNAEIIAATLEGKFSTAKIKDLYPRPFTKKDITK